MHGVALKPGKPICLGASGRRPVAILPGFPTSAVFTFHEFVAPVLRMMSGCPRHERERVEARLARKIVSERGRLEYLLVGLVRDGSGSLAAWPMGKGSGSVTAFSRADGFVRVDRNTEIVDADTPVEVTLVGRDLARRQSQRVDPGSDRSCALRPEDPRRASPPGRGPSTRSHGGRGGSARWPGGARARKSRPARAGSIP